MALGALPLHPERSAFWDTMERLCRLLLYLLFDPDGSGGTEPRLGPGDILVSTGESWDCGFRLKDGGENTEARGHEGWPHPENGYNLYAKWLLVSVKLFYYGDTNIKWLLNVSKFSQLLPAAIILLKSQLAPACNPAMPKPHAPFIPAHQLVPNLSRHSPVCLLRGHFINYGQDA